MLAISGLRCTHGWPNTSRTDLANQRVQITLLVGVSLFLGWWSARLLPVGTLNDDAAYYLMACEYAGLLDGPTVVGQLRGAYPFGYSVILAPFCWVFGGSVTLLRVFHLLVCVGICGLVTGIARRFVSPPVALGVGFLYLLHYQSVIISQGFYSETPLNAILFGALLWEPVARKASLKQRLALGFMLGFGVHIRFPAILLVAAIAIAWLLEKNYRETVEFLLGAGLVVGAGRAYSAWSEFRASLRIEQVKTFYQETSLWEAQYHFWLGFLEMGGNFLSAPAFRWVFGAAFLVAAMVGAFRQGVRGPLGATILFIVFYVGLHSVWPYRFDRYFLVLWPLMVLFILTLLNPKAQQICIGCILVWSMGITSYRVATARPFTNFDGYRWLAENAPKNARVLDPMHNTARYYTRLEAYPPVDTTAIPYYLLQASFHQAEFLVMRNRLVMQATYTGRSPLEGHHRLLAFLNRSTLVKRIYADQTVVIFRIEVDALVFIRAYQAYQRASQAFAESDYERSKELLDKVLSLVGDFPEAEELLAGNYMQLKQPQKAIETLQGVSERYPFYYAARQNLVATLNLLERKEEAREEARRAERYAREAGDLREAALFGSLIEQLR